MKYTFINMFGIVGMLLIFFSAITYAQDTTAQKTAQPQHGQNFVDENGDGYNDNAPDHDGDGIPNGLDPDWKKLQKRRQSMPFVDLDGDGINDNLNAETNPADKIEEMKNRDTGKSIEENQQQQQKQRGKNRQKQ